MGSRNLKHGMGFREMKKWDAILENETWEWYQGKLKPGMGSRKWNPGMESRKWNTGMGSRKWNPGMGPRKTLHEMINFLECPVVSLWMFNGLNLRFRGILKILLLI